MQGYYNSLVFNLLACAQRREEASAGLHVEAAAFLRYDSDAMQNSRDAGTTRPSIANNEKQIYLVRFKSRGSNIEIIK